MGSVHWDLRLGPVGPLKIARWSSPQRPSNVDPWEALLRRRGVARDRLYGRAESTVGPVVSSQPTPSEAELPR